SLLLSGAGHTQDHRLTSIGDVARTRAGRVRGLIKNGIHQFWCVPYGAPTGGMNRFMPPQAPEPWSGVRDHFEIRYSAPTRPGDAEPAPVVAALNRFSPQSEDCLSVNVFTPGLDNKERPVMVWMHGGGFRTGAGNFLLYDGTNLAKKEDVVVVAVNHRLNLYGFLHLADIGGRKWEQSTNVGMQDLVAALEWVRDNIEEFGGDPQRVTIFGQSGGGGKTTTLMAMPSAEGLVHRCIAQSGFAFNGQPADVASEQTELFLHKLGIRTNQLDRLQEMSLEEMQAALYSDPAIPGLALGPVIDGEVIPRDQWDPTAPSYALNVPIIVGSTETENGWVGPPPYDLSDADMRERFRTRLTNGDAAEADRLIALYRRIHPGMRNQMLWLTAESDNTRRRDAQLIARLKHEQGGAPAYLYFFDWYSPVHDDRMGSYHTLDIPFVFYNMDIGASMTGAKQARYELAHIMSAAWAAFARTGDPNHSYMPHWPTFDPATYPTMMFGDQVRVKSDPNRETREALTRIHGDRQSNRLG
ncbi:MAG: carboxylesterase family protein, partial [Gammaproteobacteria bacterium]